MKAGIEHFGRGVPGATDIIIGVLDYTLESVSIAHRMAGFCADAGIAEYWLILNKVGSDDIADIMLEKLGDLRGRVIGKISFDPDLVRRGLVGDPVGTYASLGEFKQIAGRLEELLANGDADTTRPE
jgi:CO dehydrogenase maturation factor